MRSQQTQETIYAFDSYASAYARNPIDIIASRRKLDVDVVAEWFGLGYGKSSR